jgi:hypothetical protein
MEELDLSLLGPEQAREDDRVESLLRFTEERTLRRVTARLGIVTALLALLTGAGFYLLWAQLESVRQTAYTGPVAAPGEREPGQRPEEQLGELHERIAKAQARLQDLAAETERRLASIERQQGEHAQGVERLAERVEEASAARSEPIAPAVERLAADLAGIERLSRTMHAPLAKKLAILSGLSFDPQDGDAEAHRALAVVVLKDLADPALVRAEGQESGARTILSRLAEDRRLRDDRFTEVRLRVLRAVAELRLVDIATARSTDAAAWERRNWILVLGALGDAAGMPSLAAMAGSGKEAAEIRAAALRSLASFRIAGAGPETAGWWADEEIAALAPTRGAPPAIPRHRPEVRQALRTATGIATNRRESPTLRRTALAVLQRMGDESVVGDLRLVLFEEWNVLGEEILQALTGIGGGAAADLLRDFALAPLGGTELRLHAIVGLRTLGGNRALVALDRIAQEVADAELATAAQRALVTAEGGTGPSRTTGDLRPPGRSRW